MYFPEELRYSKSHEWVALDGDRARIGLTDYAQSELGDIVFVNLPMVGDAVTASASMGDVESVKAVSEIICPVTGVVAAVNEELLDAPQLINETPYEAWLIEVEAVTAQDELLTAADYEAFLKTLEE